MKKGYYIIYEKLDYYRLCGIEKKILLQKKLFEHLGLNIKFITLSKKLTFWNYKIDYSNCDFIYFRKSTIIDFNFLYFFYCLKRDNPNIVIFMEIPTFPYEGEYKGTIYGQLSIIIDKIFRIFCKYFIDYVVVVGIYTKRKIWGIEVINIINGIDVKNIKKQVKINNNSKYITIGCIAKFSKWHGYERIIEGLYKYYQDGGRRYIKLLMVGEGDEKIEYEKLVEKYNLNNHVEFTGLKVGKELDNIFNIIDIGCCSLGRYKSGIDIIGDLKSRDFMARGIPMILGCNIDILCNLYYEFAIQFPNNSSPIDINKVIKFYDNLLYQYHSNIIINKIRSYAYKYIDIHITYKPVLDKIKEIFL